MKLKDLTTSNIQSFFSGYWGLFLNKLNLQPEHIQEQIIFRAKNCPSECAQTNSCKFCGCDRDGKLFTFQSCNLEKNLPNLMEEKEWNEYKLKNKNNGIQF